MSHIRNEQQLGRHNKGYAMGHHHVLCVLNGHQFPASSITGAPSLNAKFRSRISRHTASTSGEPLASPCWIGLRIAATILVSGSSERTSDSGKPRGQISSLLKYRYAFTHRPFVAPTDRAVATDSERSCHESSGALSSSVS